ncbi:MAG TPA: sigma-70 family RNA polymerase sigma factor, partial [Pyrinomonadaceae bacterium]|nr:sigma-70 family RNA polymerase sigma factor [Pyrinomonadaceae bacterium]
MTSAEKHKNTIDEAIARLISRAANSRGLSAADLQTRVVSALEKYLWRDDENASAADVKSFVDEIKADDLCLIIACENGDDGAWEDLVKGYDSTVKSAAGKYAKNAEDAEDLAGSIWAELYGLKKDSDGRLKTKLVYYSGRGSLAGWLRAVTNQLAVDRFRKESKFVQIEENREFENLANESSENTNNIKIVHASDNPEENFSRKQTEKDVSEAFKQAIAELEAEDKLILKLYYFDDLKLKDIGNTLGFHEATASRKLDRIQKEIRKSVEKILQAKHGWKPEEVKSYLAETASKLGISFERLFTITLISALVQENFWRG